MVVHTDVLPPRLVFQAKLGVAVAPDLAKFHAEFKDTAGDLTASPGHTTVTYQTPAADNAANPPAKVSLDLKEVPSFLDFTVKQAASVKAGNPNETCGLAESNFVLPTIAYDSDGANRNLMDVSGELDMSFIEAGAPKIVMEMTNLADSFTISNTDAGKAFNLENPGLTTTKVLVKVIPFDLKLLDLN